MYTSSAPLSRQSALDVLHSHPEETLSFAEEMLVLENEEKSLDLELDSSLNRMESGSNSTNGIAIAATNITIQNSSSTNLELWGIPIESVILLNLVAIIWGTQHSVIKSVVDDSTVGLGAGFVKWTENMGLHVGTFQNSVSGESIAGGDSTAAYFTLARFGLAALLAAPYTPGWRLIGEKLGVREPMTQVNGEPMQEGDAGVSSAPNRYPQANTIDDRESIRLAWKYGAELGLYMFLGYAFQAIGLETTTASRSGFLLYLNVKFVPFFSYFIFGKRIQRSTWISALVAFGGTALLAFDNANADTGFEFAFSVGDLWSIAAAAASAMFILRMEAASRAVPKSSELNAANLWTVAVLSFLWTLGISWNELSGTEVNIDATEFVHAIQQTFEQTFATIIKHPLALIYLSGVTTALANFLQSKAQKDVSAERASVIYSMDPLYGAIFANVLLGETLGAFGLIGAFLILVAAATNAVMDFSDKSAEEADRV